MFQSFIEFWPGTGDIFKFSKQEKSVENYTTGSNTPSSIQSILGKIKLELTYCAFVFSFGNMFGNKMPICINYISDAANG